MTSFTITQYDDLPVLDEVLLDGAGAPIDLSLASAVRLQARYGVTLLIDRQASIVAPATDGRVQFKFTGGPDGETSTARKCIRQWLIIWTNGDTDRVPTDGFDELIIFPAAGPNP